MKNMLRGAEYFARLQGAVMSRDLQLFDEFPKQERRNIADARRLIVGEWIRRFQIEAREPLLEEGLNIPQWLFRDLYGNEPTPSLLGIRINFVPDLNKEGRAGKVLSLDRNNGLYTVQLDGNSTSVLIKPPVWGWTEEQESNYQNERREFEPVWLSLTESCTREEYVRAELNNNDSQGFSSAHVVITNQGRALMLIQRLKKAKGEAKLILGLTGGQRKIIGEEDAWKCACREADEETGGFAKLRGAVPPAHVAWLGIKQQEGSKWVEGKVVYMYETADRLLAEHIQNLCRPPEGTEGLLPPEGAPLTAVWVPLARLRDSTFRRDYLPKWAQDERIWIDLATCEQRRAEEEKVAAQQKEALLRQLALDAHARRRRAW
jgi:hypothetical protein